MLFQTVYSAEVANHNAVCRTNLCAVSAVRALVIVDLRQIILDSDRTDRAFLFTLFVGDSAMAALFSCNCALFGVAAGDEYLFNIRHN